MRLPFGIDLKSVVITVAFLYFVLPFVLRLWASKTAKSK